MREIIIEKIAEIERAECVRIIRAVESGSRAWGFASPDSDFDVRFIYVRPRDFYLRLDKTRDVIEWQLDDTLDINGWDLQKALRLLYASNLTLFEWSNSPIVYKSTEEWERVCDVAADYFSVKSALNHYFSMANSHFGKSLKSETVSFKKYFYALRPLLACRWILYKKSPPPMLFEELAEAELDSGMIPIVRNLLDKKRSSPELGTGDRIERLNNYIEEKLAELKVIIENLPPENRPGWDKLNAVFCSEVG